VELILQRTNLTPESTEGELFLHGAGNQLAVTLELPVKDGLPGSAIPPGKYLIQMLPSPKFEMSTDPWVLQYAGNIPHVLGIPNRSNILIHFGNTAKDTEGCILVGQESGDNFIAHSRPAFAALWEKLIAAKSAGEVITLQVIGGISEVVTNHDNVQQAVAED
jgi:Family of unknown function (DUF5675)